MKRQQLTPQAQETTQVPHLGDHSQYTTTQGIESKAEQKEHLMGVGPVNIYSPETTSSRNGQKRGRSATKGRKSLARNTFVHENSLLVGANNLSIRKLLENTGSDMCVKSADTDTSKVKLNGHLSAPFLESDLKYRPSLPISIPLDCLPGNNVEKTAKPQLINSGEGKKDPPLNDHETSESPSIVGTQGSLKMLKASIDHSEFQSKYSAWTSSNFIASSPSIVTSSNNLNMEKMVIPKKHVHVLNGNDSNYSVKQILFEAKQQTSQTSTETSKFLKRKYSKEQLFITKKHINSDFKGEKCLERQETYLLATTGSPQFRGSTAMLISTANQPLGISAIPSPDVKNGQLIGRNDQTFTL